MKLFLGIDGGGTHTTGCLADESGQIIARAEAGYGNPNHATDDELRTNFEDLLQQLFGSSDNKKNCVSVFAGIAGVTCEKTAVRIRRALDSCGLGHCQVGIDHDIRIALAGGLMGGPGIALIVGTGSSCYGRDASGNTWQTGGWGSLIADEGSGYYLGRESIAAAVQMADGRRARTPLLEAVFAWLGINNVSQVLERVYEQELTRAQIAAFAPQLLSLADKEDPAALEILEQGADDLAAMVAANHRCLKTSPNPQVVITGGLGTADSCYRPLIERAINRALSEATIVRSILDPTTGAALLALEQHFGSISESQLNNLKGLS